MPKSFCFGNGFCELYSKTISVNYLIVEIFVAFMEKAMPLSKQITIEKIFKILKVISCPTKEAFKVVEVDSKVRMRKKKMEKRQRKMDFNIFAKHKIVHFDCLKSKTQKQSTRKNLKNFVGCELDMIAIVTIKNIHKKQKDITLHSQVGFWSFSQVVLGLKRDVSNTCFSTLFLALILLWMKSMYVSLFCVDSIFKVQAHNDLN